MFWRPVADLLPAEYERVFLEWPGHGAVPPDPRVSTFDHLVALVTDRMDRPADLSLFRTEDWRPSYRREYPAAPDWLLDYRADLSDRIWTIDAPVLLLWGGSDPISPVPVGEYLARLLPRATLIVIPGGTHIFAEERPAEVARYVAAHLAEERL